MAMMIDLIFFLFFCLGDSRGIFEVKLDPDWDHFKVKLKHFLKRTQICNLE